MNIKVVLLFITINMFVFAQYTSVTNNNILVNIGEGRVTILHIQYMQMLQPILSLIHVCTLKHY